MATNNGYSGTLVPRIGYTRSVCFRNRVQQSFGQSGAVLGVFLYLIFAVPGNGYLTTGYTRSWLFPFNLLVHEFAWVWMALRARNASPWSLATLNPQSTCHGPRPGPYLRRGVRAGPLRAPEPRAREKSHGRKRKKTKVQRKHIYYNMHNGSRQRKVN